VLPLFALLPFACGLPAAPDAGSSASTDPADAFDTSVARERCQLACDTQLSFDCHDVSDFQSCDAACEDAPPDVAEAYARCVQASDFCDADCDTILHDEPVSGPPDAAPSCYDECVAFARACDPDMAFICGDACGLAEELVLSCLDNAWGCELTPACEELVE
jgi:hypothetical protein